MLGHSLPEDIEGQVVTGHLVLFCRVGAVRVSFSEYVLA